ncbi:hypothetical protein Salmuc_03082 [Salipiger mucosus DSM 16094]|uniref:Uncharacterized protein n=1 Tax=Salipiger mucosus DSM 16094 TaxID=1123237 RepID=S9S7S6_9RHOB|nr:hypothetical protein Salmuc_03082 [Salipiger mucosus DSM 16094]
MQAAPAARGSRLPGKEEPDAGRLAAGGEEDLPLGVEVQRVVAGGLDLRPERVQRLGQLGGFRRDHRGTPAEMTVAGGAAAQFDGEVAHLGARELGRDAPHVVDGPGEIPGRGGGEEEEFAVLRGVETGTRQGDGDRGVRPARRLGQGDMRVDAAEAHGADPGAALLPGGVPVLGPLAGAEVVGMVREKRVRVVAGGGRRQNGVAQDLRGAQQAREARGGLGVADVGLDRADDRRAQGRAGLGAFADEGGQLGRVADAGAGAVALEVADRVDAVARAPVGPREGHALAVDLGAREPAPPVRGDAPTGDDGLDVLALLEGVLEPHQRDEAAALAGPEALGPFVVDAHLGPGERGGAREADQLEWVEAEVHAPRKHHVCIAHDQRSAGVGDRQQRGGTGAVDGKAAALEVEVVADAPGDGVGQTASEHVLVRAGEGRLVARLERGEMRGQLGLGHVGAVLAQLLRDDAADVGPAQAHERGAGELAGEGVAHDHAHRIVRDRRAGLAEADGLDAVLRDGQGQPVGEVRDLVAGLRNPEPVAVEGKAVEHRRLVGIGPVGGAALGVEVVRRQTPRRHPAEGAALRERVLEEGIDGVGLGIPAGHADDGDRAGSGHGGTPRRSGRVGWAGPLRVRPGAPGGRGVRTA